MSRPESILLNRRGAGLAFLPILAVLLVGGVPGVSAEEACRSVELSEPPAWVYSGALDPDGDRLWLVDTFRQSVVGYDLSGRRVETLRSVTTARGETLEIVRPAILQAREGGFTLELEDGQFLFLDGDMKLDRTVAGSGMLDALDLQADGDTVGSVFSWAAAGSRLYTISDLKSEAGTWRSAILDIDLSTTEPSVRVLREFETGSTERSFYLLGQPTLAASEDAMVMTVMESQPYLSSLAPSGDLESLDHVWSGQPLPTLSKAETIDSFVNIFAELSRSAVPAGAYRVGEQTFILERSMKGEIIDGWTLTRIDDAGGSTPLYLPTRADHLTLVLGHGSLVAAVEKGRVEALGQQAIPSVLLIPTSWLTGDSSPLLTHSGALAACGRS